MSRPWRVVIAPFARRDLNDLPPKATLAIMETVEAIAANPHRLGKPLHDELSDRRSARYGSYRVLFRVDSATHTVTISAIGHRSHIYRQR